MVKYTVECEECDREYECDNEDEAVGWMFGHAMSSGHDNIEKYESE